MKKALAWALMLVLAGCRAAEPHLESWHGFVMDTVAGITIHGTGFGNAMADAIGFLHSADTRLSRFNPNSDIASGVYASSTQTLLDTADEWRALTGGAFDIRVAHLMDFWRDAESSEQPFSVWAEQAAVLAKQPGGIDLGGIVKGYAGNYIAGLLPLYGVSSAVVDLGGDIVLVGEHPEGRGFRVGIRDPFDPGAVPIAVLTVANTSVFTSGAYERGFVINGQRYSHILDPRTGLPAASGVASVTVVAPCGIMADALSTALTVMGLEASIAFWRTWEGAPFDAVIICNGGVITATPGLQGYLSASGVVWVGVS